MISKEMVRDGIHNGSIHFVKDPNMEHGTVCQIGDDWFYFGCLKAEELDPDEYVESIPEDDVVGLVFNTLEEFREDGAFDDEYAYYEAYLTERWSASNMDTLQTRDAKLEQLWGEFADVPMNPETEEMEEPFLHFPVGTNREEIWHWFDERHSKGVVYLLYGTEPKYSLKNMAPLVRAQSLCCECGSETCVFNPKGICMVPFVTGNAPGLSEDGCTDYCYKEDSYV